MSTELKCPNCQEDVFEECWEGMTPCQPFSFIGKKGTVKKGPWKALGNFTGHRFQCASCWTVFESTNFDDLRTELEYLNALKKGNLYMADYDGTVYRCEWKEYSGRGDILVHAHGLPVDQRVELSRLGRTEEEALSIIERKLEICCKDREAFLERAKGALEVFIKGKEKHKNARKRKRAR